MNTNLYFLWDYEMTEQDVLGLLRHGSEMEKKWLMGRILTNAQYQDVWHYLTVQEVADNLAGLRMRPRDKANWQRALKVWGYEV